ncbi:MAG: acetyl-CoA carboxylase biotin carboxyl carrier protein [Brotaphodocola sp.]
MNIEEIVTLIEAVSQNGLTSLELEEGNLKLSLKKKPEQQIVTVAAPVDMSVNTAGSNMANKAAGSVAVNIGNSTESTQMHMISGGNAAIDSDKVVSSPLVGTFYSSPSPDAEPFVKVGDQVKKGQVLGIIEAMKLMNEIESECDGIVDAILIDNEEVVEYGQPLFRIR